MQFYCRQCIIYWINLFIWMNWHYIHFSFYSYWQDLLNVLNLIPKVLMLSSLFIISDVPVSSYWKLLAHWMIVFILINLFWVWSVQEQERKWFEAVGAKYWLGLCCWWPGGSWLAETFNSRIHYLRPRCH